MIKTITKEILIIGFCYLLFALAKNLTDPSPVLKAVANGWLVLRLESALALNWEVFIQQVISKISMGMLIAATYFYVLGMWLGLVATALITFIKCRATYIDLRRTFVISMILGAIIFAIFPLAPPRFMPGLGMTDTVMMVGLDPAPNSDSAISYNRFAAMPSLHYAWALLIMTAMFRIGGIWSKIFGFVYQALMFIAIIATANHYVLDALAGAILLVISININRWIKLYSDHLNMYLNDARIYFRNFHNRLNMQISNMHLSHIPDQLLSNLREQNRYTNQHYNKRLPSHRVAEINSYRQMEFRPEFTSLSFILN